MLMLDVMRTRRRQEKQKRTGGRIQEPHRPLISVPPFLPFCFRDFFYITIHYHHQEEVFHSLRLCFMLWSCLVLILRLGRTRHALSGSRFRTRQCQQADSCKMKLKASQKSFCISNSSILCLLLPASTSFTPWRN